MDDEAACRAILEATGVDIAGATSTHELNNRWLRALKKVEAGSELDAQLEAAVKWRRGVLEAQAVRQAEELAGGEKAAELRQVGKQELLHPGESGG
jgi:hypothetical protein